MDEGATFDILNNNISNKFIGKNAKDFNIEIDINKNIDGKNAEYAKRTIKQANDILKEYRKADKIKNSLLFIILLFMASFIS